MVVCVYPWLFGVIILNAVYHGHCGIMEAHTLSFSSLEVRVILQHDVLQTNGRIPGKILQITLPITLPSGFVWVNANVNGFNTIDPSSFRWPPEGQWFEPVFVHTVHVQSSGCTGIIKCLAPTNRVNYLGIQRSLDNDESFRAGRRRNQRDLRRFRIRYWQQLNKLSAHDVGTSFRILAELPSSTH